MTCSIFDKFACLTRRLSLLVRTPMNGSIHTLDCRSLPIAPSCEQNCSTRICSWTETTSAIEHTQFTLQYSWELAQRRISTDPGWHFPSEVSTHSSRDVEPYSFFLHRSIWEKFLAGSEYVFVFLTVHILHHCRMKLLGLYSTKELIQYLVDLKVRTGCYRSTEALEPTALGLDRRSGCLWTYRHRFHCFVEEARWIIAGFSPDSNLINQRCLDIDRLNR